MAVKALLDRKKHPFYRHAEAEFFLARRDGQPVGRVAAILDRNYNRFHEEETGFFGFFECADSPELARMLLTTARGWLRSRGACVMRGPVNPSTNYECGLLIDGFDSDPFVMMTYNPPYYAALMDGVGLHKAKDLYAYHAFVAKADGSKVQRVAERALQANGIAIRPISMKHFWKDVEALWGIYNSAWSRNWGFVPMTRDEFMAMAKEMKLVLSPDLVLVGEAGGRVVGFALGLPDVNQALKPARGRLFPLGLVKILYYRRLITNLRIVALGVVEEFRTAGVAAAFYATLFRNGVRLGYTECEMSWVLEDNILMHRSLVAMGASRYKTYRIYEWN
jgi:GNAT superfamily N-acetyltransferase